MDRVRLEGHTPVIRIYLLGQCRLERWNRSEWQEVHEAAWQQRRIRTFLGCLLSVPSRMLGREQVMEALWPETDLETAANRLNITVHSLRQLLEPDLARPANSSLLRLEHDIFRFASQQRVWLDADHFEMLLQQALQTQELSERESLLEEAMALYRGDFLQGEQIASWVTVRRETLQRKWFGVLLALADSYMEKEAFVQALALLEKLLQAYPAHEAAACRLMRVLALQGSRTEALLAYRRLEATLWKFYGAEPLPETRALYEQLQSSGQVGAMHPRLPLPVARGTRCHFVGREYEYQRILEQADALQSDKEGFPHSLFLTGEPGIGKTRLAEEVSRALSERGWAILWNKVYEQEQTVSYRLWIDVLRQLSGLEQVQGMERVLRETLSGLLLSSAPSWSARVARERFSLTETLLECLYLAGQKAPILLIFDDLHYADRASIEVFATIVRRVWLQPVLLLGTCNPLTDGEENGLQMLIRDLQAEQRAWHLELKPLPSEQIGRLLRRCSPAIQRSILEYAHGNPFFAIEFIHAIQEMEQQQGENEILYTLKFGSLPSTIAAAVDLRLEKLSEQCRQVLSKVAVLDHPFPFELVALMTQGQGGLSQMLEEALQAGILLVEKQGEQELYRFAHPLFGKRLYERLSAARQASLHRLAGEALSRLYKQDEEEVWCTISYHLLKGGQNPFTQRGKREAS